MITTRLQIFRWYPFLKKGLENGNSFALEALLQPTIWKLTLALALASAPLVVVAFLNCSMIREMVGSGILLLLVAC